MYTCISLFLFHRRVANLFTFPLLFIVFLFCAVPMDVKRRKTNRVLIGQAEYVSLT